MPTSPASIPREPTTSASKIEAAAPAAAEPKGDELEKSDPDVVEKLQSVGQVLYTNVRGSSRLAQLDSGTALRGPFSLEELREAVAAALRHHR